MRVHSRLPEVDRYQTDDAAIARFHNFRYGSIVALRDTPHIRLGKIVATNPSGTLFTIETLNGVVRKLASELKPYLPEPQPS